MEIDRKLLDHIASLAYLPLQEEEAERLLADLRAILAHVADLEVLDTTGVSPIENVELEPPPLRADELVPSLSHGDALAAAPRQADGGFAVPTFMGG